MVRLKFAVFLGWKNDQSLVDRIVKFVKPVIEKDHDLIIIGECNTNIITIMMMIMIMVIIKYMYEMVKMLARKWL